MRMAKAHFDNKTSRLTLHTLGVTLLSYGHSVYEGGTSAPIGTRNQIAPITLMLC